MGKKEQVPALAIFVQGSLWVWSATSRGRPHLGLALGGLEFFFFSVPVLVPVRAGQFFFSERLDFKILLAGGCTKRLGAAASGGTRRGTMINVEDG